MSIPDQTIISAALQDFSKPLTDIILGAWQDWQKSGYAASWTKRGRANFVWEQMKNRAKVAFNDASRIRLIENHETVKFLVDDNVLFRLKKGDEAGLSANYPTQLALAFHDHEADLLGMREAMRVDIIYKLNRLETLVQDILVVGRDNDTVLWCYSIMDSGAIVTELPINSLSQPATGPKKLVRPRVADGLEQKSAQG